MKSNGNPKPYTTKTGTCPRCEYSDMNVIEELGYCTGCFNEIKRGERDKREAKDTAYKRMERIAAAILTNYQADFYVHDRSIIHEIQTSDFAKHFLWIIRPTGTMIVHPQSVGEQASGVDYWGKSAPGKVLCFLVDLKENVFEPKTVNDAVCIARAWDQNKPDHLRNRAAL